MDLVNVRKEALSAILQVTENGAYASLVIRAALGRFPEDTPERDRSLFTNLVYTTVRNLSSIDEALSRASKTPVSKMDAYIRGALRMGVCQLWYLSGVKPYAAISETVDLIKHSRWKHLAGYGNAVLRAVQKMPHPENRAVLPDWVKESFVRDYGRERAQQLEEVMTSPGTTTFRINTLKGSPEEIRNAVTEKVSCTEGSLCREALYLSGAVRIDSFAPYLEGLVSVQDESSILAAKLTDVRPGMKVLDLCAAPGGKSTMMAQMMQDQGVIVSRDLYEQRVGLIRQNAERLGIHVILAQTADGTVPLREDEEGYDVVLLDAPCSGLGVLRSRPDIALHHSEETVSELLPLQEKLLETAALAVKKGGRLVYSTCTLSKRENNDRIEAFLKKHDGFSLVDLKDHPALSALKEGEALVEKHLTLWPVPNGHDGFFVAVLTRSR